MVKKRYKGHKHAAGFTPLPNAPSVRMTVLEKREAQFKNAPTQRSWVMGFTLMESVVVVALLGLIGIVATNTLASLLRISSRSEIVKELKQNGDYALSILETRIRSAKTIEGISCSASGGTSNAISIRNLDNSLTTIGCYADTTSSPSINRFREGGSGTAWITSDDVTISSCTQVFTCYNLGPGTPPNNLIINFTLNNANSSVLKQNVPSAAV